MAKYLSYFSSKKKGAAAGLVLAALFFFISVPAACSETPKVGTAILSYEAEPNQPTTVRLWFPTADPAKESTFADGIYSVHAVPDALPDFSKGKLGLVLLSHGDQGHRASLAWLGRWLAQHGFLVAAPEHPGTNYRDETPTGVLQIGRRPGHLSRLLDVLQHSAVYGHAFDPDRIAAIGFSLGGATVLSLEGARYVTSRILKFCSVHKERPDCGLIVGAHPTAGSADTAPPDPRFKAIVSVSPGFIPGYSVTSLRLMSVPLLVIGSRDDQEVPYASDAAFVAQEVPGAKLITLHGVGHYSFLTGCTAKGREILPVLCKDSGTVSRHSVHLDVRGPILDFLLQHLNGDTETTGAAAR